MEARYRPFRFGTVTTAGTDVSRTQWSEHARRVEDLGFSTLLVADHFHNSTVCTPRLAAAAAVTTTLRVGSYVYDNDFRHPVLLAREAAEIDLLSDGRMELGIGAGWAPGAGAAPRRSCGTIESFSLPSPRTTTPCS